MIDIVLQESEGVMAATSEQIDRHEYNRRYKSYLKKVATRTLRRQSRRDPEGAAVRPRFRGYSM